MNPEDIHNIVTALSKSKPIETSMLSYLIYGFFAVLTPFIWWFARFINRMYKIMGMHIEELRHILIRQEKLEEKYDSLSKDYSNTKLQVRENKTLVEVLKDKCA